MNNRFDNDMEELLKSAFLERDLNQPENEALIDAISEVTLARPSGVTNSILNSLWVKWGLIGTLIFVVTFGLVLYSNGNEESLYQPFVSQLKVEDFTYEDEFKVNKIAPKGTSLISEMPSPPLIRNTEEGEGEEQEALIKAPIEESEVKVYRPEKMHSNVQLGTASMEIHKKKKSQFLKEVLRINKGKLSKVEVALDPMMAKYELKTDFLAWKTEVTNEEYSIFLHDLVIQGKLKEYELAKVDSTGWTRFKDESYLEPLENMYAWHPAYANYPVVNISRTGAELFCKWLSEELASLKENKLGLRKVSLPTNRQWEYMASSGNKYFPYPWGGPSTMNDKKSYLANYYPSPDKATDDGGLLTVTAGSYNPNDFGLFNLSGNVAEMVTYNNREDKVGTKGGSWYSTEEELKIKGPDPYLGVTVPQPTIGFRPIILYAEDRIEVHKSTSSAGSSVARLTKKQRKENEKRKRWIMKRLIKFREHYCSDKIKGAMVFGEDSIIIKNAFSIEKFEVSNIDYKTFLFDLILQGRYKEFEIAKPHFELWNNVLGANAEDYIENYFQNERFNNYPVVNVSAEGAELYGKWMLEEVQKVDFKGSLKGVETIRLPTHNEWVAAASELGRYKKYPWRGHELKVKTKDGELYRANFKHQPSTSENSPLQEKVTMNVFTSFTGASGTCRMAGNVSEMVKYASGVYGSKGGNWNAPVEALEINSEDKTKGKLLPSPMLGFRLVIEWKSEKPKREAAFIKKGTEGWSPN